MKMTTKIMGRCRLGASLAAVAVSAVAATASSGVATAEPNAATTLVAAGLAIDQSQLTGVQLGTFTVSLHLTDSGGVQQTLGTSNGDKVMLCPCARLETVDATGAARPWRQAQAMDVRAVALHLTSGTANDGIWSGTTTVGSAGAGRWQLTGVDAGSIHDGSPPYAPSGAPTWHDVDGATYGATVDVVGSHWPILSVRIPTTTVAYGNDYRLIGHAVYSDTRAPVAGLRVGVTDDAPDEWPLDPVYHYATTDKNGLWSVIADDPTDRIGALYGAVAVPFSADKHDVQYTAMALVSVRPIHWVVNVTTGTSGRMHLISVRLRPHLATNVQLQRHESDGWHVVGTHASASNGAFTFSTSRHGTWRVRALLVGPNGDEGKLAPYTSIAVRT
jgi:hypothetical protein